MRSAKLVSLIHSLHNNLRMSELLIPFTRSQRFVGWFLRRLAARRYRKMGAVPASKAVNFHRVGNTIPGSNELYAMSWREDRAVLVPPYAEFDDDGAARDHEAMSKLVDSLPNE